MNIRDSDRHIFLQIQEYNYPQNPIETFLLNPQMAEAFRWAVTFNKQKNEYASVMHLNYYGYANGGFPIVSISGRRFFKYLIPSA
jgi:hypothetical protein